MPTYEYRCRNCGHTFDVVQAMSDEALTVCPVCGGELRKVFAPPAISFKGSGFYQTDYRSESYKAKAKADKPPESSSSKPAESGSNGAKSEGSKPSASTNGASS